MIFDTVAARGVDRFGLPGIAGKPHRYSFPQIIKPNIRRSTAYDPLIPPSSPQRGQITWDAGAIDGIVVITGRLSHFLASPSRPGATTRAVVLGQRLEIAL